MPIATMTSKGQVTIPKKVREAIGLYEGSRVDFEVLPDGTALLRVRKKPLTSLFGKFSTGGIKVRIHEMSPASPDAFK